MILCWMLIAAVDVMYGTIVKGEVKLMAVGLPTNTEVARSNVTGTGRFCSDLEFSFYVGWTAVFGVICAVASTMLGLVRNAGGVDMTREEEGCAEEALSVAAMAASAVANDIPTVCDEGTEDAAVPGGEGPAVDATVEIATAATAATTTTAATAASTADADDRAKLFNIVLCVPSFVAWLVCASFLGACRSTAHTHLVPFGITATVIYAATTVVLGAMWWRTEGRGRGAKVAVADDAEGGAMAEGGARLGAREGAGALWKWVLKVGSYQVVGVCFHLTLYLLLCWSMYIVNQEVVKARVEFVSSQAAAKVARGGNGSSFLTTMPSYVYGK